MTPTHQNGESGKKGAVDMIMTKNSFREDGRISVDRLETDTQHLMIELFCLSKTRSLVLLLVLGPSVSAYQSMLAFERSKMGKLP
jgi:hypothetical protein